MWVVTRYEDAVTILKDPARFSSSLAYDDAAGFLRLTDQARQALESVLPLSTLNLANADPPNHGRLRNVLETAFGPGAIVRFEPTIRDIADQLIDGFVNEGEVDIIDKFAAELPIRAITRMIGVPETDLVQVKQWHLDWSTLFLNAVPDERQLSLAKSVAALHRYLAFLTESRRSKPAADLTSLMVREIDSGRSGITFPELVSILSQLIAAGTQTTTSAIGTCLYRLLQHPTYWESVTSSPELRAKAVEEALRCNQSLRGILRVATETTQVGGINIARGTRLYVLSGAANRDEAIFTHADVFDPRRDSLRRHLAFGVGIHRCLGTALARLEMCVSLERLNARLPELELTPYGADVISSPMLKTLGRLPVRWRSIPTH